MQISIPTTSGGTARTSLNCRPVRMPRWLRKFFLFSKCDTPTVERVSISCPDHAVAVGVIVTYFRSKSIPSEVPRWLGEGPLRAPPCRGLHLPGTSCVELTGLVSYNVMGHAQPYPPHGCDMALLLERSAVKVSVGIRKKAVMYGQKYGRRSNNITDGDIYVVNI